MSVEWWSQILVPKDLLGLGEIEVVTYSFNCSLASWLIFSRSWLLLLGLMALASSSSNTSSPSFSSSLGCSLGTIIVPLDFRDVILGR